MAGNNINYQKELDKVIAGLDAARRPRLLLHSCCAPCSSYCLIYLKEYFDITCYYYNPNITDVVEYFKRLSELERLAAAINEEQDALGIAGTGQPIRVIDGGFNPSEFFDAARGLENEREGGLRCKECFKLRLYKSYEAALAGGFDYYTTTLTISPLKNAQLINEIGASFADGITETGIAQADGITLKWLPSDFKKKGGYQQSIELSKKYGLYRQNYCGCCYSMRDAHLL